MCMCVSSLFLLSLESSRILSYLVLTTHTLGRVLYWFLKHRKKEALESWNLPKAEE